MTDHEDQMRHPSPAPTFRLWSLGPTTWSETTFDVPIRIHTREDFEQANLLGRWQQQIASRTDIDHAESLRALLEGIKARYGAINADVKASAAATLQRLRSNSGRLTASTISDDDLDQLYTDRDRDTATLREIRRVVEKARHTRTGSQAADRVMQAFTATLLGILGPAPEGT